MRIQVSLFLTALTLTATLNATTYNCANFTLPGASSTFISGINNSGALVGNYTTGNVTHGFFASSSSGNFQTVDYPGGTNTKLFAINNNGVATGEFNFNVSGQTPGWFTVDSSLTFKPVTPPAGYSLSSIYGINDNGAISAAIVNTSTSAATFAILNPDGTFTPVAGYNLGSGFGLAVPGSVNTTPKMLLEGASGFGGTAIADTNGNVTTIPMTFAWGLNNAGLVVGYAGSYNGHEIPFFQYSWDSSTGVNSDLLCPGIASGNIPDVFGINDNGVVVGNTLIMTPVTGEPQISLSTNSVTFPPVAVGQTTPPQTVTLSNTGNARLDIGAINESTGEVSISGCLDPSSRTASLDPGGSCTLTLRGSPTSQGTKTGTLYIHDSVTGSPQTIAVSVTGTAAPPTCTISAASQGSPKQVSFTFQDTNSGMQSIALVDASNATVNIPTFVSGSTVPLTATATQTDPSQPARADLQGTNVAGGAITCGQTFGGSLWTGLGGSFSGKVALAHDITGNIHAFVRGRDNAVWHNQQTSSGWTGWESLGGSLSGDPVVANPDAGVYEGIYVFGRGANGDLVYMRQLGGTVSWSAWASLGGAILGNPGVVSDEAGLTEVFAAGTDHALWNISQTSTGGPFGSWASFGGVIASDPFVSINVQGGTEVLAIAPDQTLWRIYKTAARGSWASWQGLGGSITGNPVALLVNNGLEVVARGTDNTLWELVQASDGSWGNWASLGGYITSNPVMAFDYAATTPEAFVRGGDNALWELSLTPSGAWTGLGGGLAGQPSAMRNDQSHLMEVFVEGTDTSLWYITQTAPDSWN